MENTTNATASTNRPTSASSIVICFILTLITILTIFGNGIVLIAFMMEKKLRTTFTMYIANLAVTDLSVGLFAMSFYTFDVFLGYWPFGEFLCGLWIFFDYGMTFASVFTLVAISVDRFWSVTWHVHYRAKNNKKKVITAILIVWLSVLAVWLPPCIYDRVQWSTPGVCKWEPSNNKEFVVFIAIVGHHSPCLALVFCYVKVFYTMQKRRGAIKPRNAAHDQEIETSRGTSVVTEESGVSVIQLPPGTNQTANPTTPGMASGEDPGSTVASTNQGTNRTAPKPSASHSADREKKIFTTLSYIIFSYLVCWVPFHVVFDLSAINPNLVPEVVYVITFWLTYLNSTLNPFLYAYCSKDFRDAFVKVIKCTYCRK